MERVKVREVEGGSSRDSKRGGLKKEEEEVDVWKIAGSSVILRLELVKEVVVEGVEEEEGEEFSKLKRWGVGVKKVLA